MVILEQVPVFKPPFRSTGFVPVFLAHPRINVRGCKDPIQSEMGKEPMWKNRSHIRRQNVYVIFSIYGSIFYFVLRNEKGLTLEHYGLTYAKVNVCIEKRT